MTLTTATTPKPATTSLAHLAHFVRLDLLAVRPYVRNLALMAIIVTGASMTTNPEPWVVLPALMVIAAMFVNYPFSLDERSHLDTLYASLPLSRTAVVLGRYLTMLAIFGCLFLVGVVAVAGLGVAKQAAVSPADLLCAAAIGFAAFAVVVGCQLPIFFAVGYTRARVLAYLPLVLLGAGLPALAHFRTWTFPSELIDHPSLLAALCVALGFVVLTVSAGVSRRLYLARTL